MLACTAVPQDQLEEQYGDKLDVEEVCRGFLDVARVRDAGSHTIVGHTWPVLFTFYWHGLIH